MAQKRNGLKITIIIALVFVCSLILAYIYPPLGIHMVLISVVVSLLVSEHKN